MGQALYRKYRSKSLSEIVGQEHITTALSNALKQGRISHAYLFTGPRGVGKTSIARILAYEVNGLPYDEKATHLDIIEIDAASNRRIDEIRELRERVHSAPASAKYKVYIIDEVHMLTKEAFNALLKTLEEPPAHAIFILATTESHKLPETIISRTQRFNFRPVEQQQVIDHLAYIAKQEKIDVSPEALQLIAQHGDGSFRDSISLLDQAGNTDKQVQLADVQRMLGIAPEQAIHDLLVVLQTGTVADLVTLLTTFRDQGYQPAQLSKQFAAQLRESLINGNLPLDQNKVTILLRGLLMVPASHDPATAFELLLIEQVIGNTDFKTSSDTISGITSAPATATVSATATATVSKSVINQQESEQPKKPAAEASEQPTEQFKKSIESSAAKVADPVKEKVEKNTEPLRTKADQLTEIKVENPAEAKAEKLSGVKKEEISEDTSAASAPTETTTTTTRIKSTAPTAPIKPTESITPTKPAEPNAPSKAVEPTELAVSPKFRPLDDETWSAVLAEIKNTQNTLYSIARMAKPHLEGNTLTLSCKFPFHQRRINETKNKQLFSDIVFRLTGTPVNIICKKTDAITDDASGHNSADTSRNTSGNTAPKNTTKPVGKSQNSAIDAISNIFGGAEILE